MDPEKSKRHLDFVSGHTGGTASEIMCLLLITCYVIFLKLEFERLFFRNLSHNTTLIIDLFCILMQAVLPCTVLSNYIIEYHMLLFLIVAIFKLKAPAEPPRTPIRDAYMAFRRLIRAIVLLYTCVCIYGVDLPVFPRRYAKTEVSGVSLMDVGVGMIVIAIGLSNAYFLGVKQTKSREKMIRALTRAALPCLALGMIRTAIVKALGYPDHETEYGIHWNFFFTLAFIRLGGFLSTYASIGMSDFDSMTIHFVLCVALASIQQFLVLPVADHVFPHLTHPEISRPSPAGNLDLWWLVQANAEGLISLPGYLSLYFYGTALGITLRLHLEPPKENGRLEKKLKFLCRQGQEEWFGNPKKVSAAVFCISIPTFLIVAAYGERTVSRRLVNLPYIALQIGLLAPPFALIIYHLFTTPVSPRKGRKDLILLYAKIADHVDLDKLRRCTESVSGHTGGTSVELMGLLLIACYIGYIKIESERLFFRSLSSNRVLLIDFFFVIVTTLLPCTLLSNYILEYHFILLAVAVIFKLKAPIDPHCIPILDGYMAFRRLIRAFVLLYSCVCIYGADLTIFPRRFAKTEISGVSLMDLGAGVIVVAIGLSNAYFVDVVQMKSKGEMVKTVMRATVPCLVIGGIRIVTTMALDYPENEMDYGVHWDFFFTLAFIRLGGFMATYAFSGMSDFDSMIIHFALCAALAFIQQFFVLPMADHMFPHLTHPEISRPSSSRYFDFWWLIQANAEGIVSLPGYLSLYFYATALGITVRLHLEPPKNNGQSEEKLKFLCRQGKEEWFGDPMKVAVAVFSISIPMFLIVAAYGESTVSRRLVNMPYIALQVGLLAPPFALFIYRSFTTPVSRRGRRDLIPFFAKIADHGILYFLVANLISGGLNFLLDSLELLNMKPAWFSNLCQFVILSIYTGFCPLLTDWLSKAVFRIRRREKMKKTD